MPIVDDLRYLGAPVHDAVRTAAFIAGMILTKRQKANLLKDYLAQRKLPMTAAIRTAADPYGDAL